MSSIPKGYSANIHVWNTDVYEDASGHVSVSLNAPQGESQYFGYWPKPEFTPLANLFTSWVPVPSQVTKSLKECQSRELDPNGTSKTPDQTYTIPLTKEEWAGMKHEAQKLQNEVNAGTTYYALLPYLSPLRYIPHLAARALNYYESFPCGDPMEHRSNELAAVSKVRVENCVTTVGRIIGVPHCQTPLGLAEILEKK